MNKIYEEPTLAVFRFDVNEPLTADENMASMQWNEEVGDY